MVAVNRYSAYDQGAMIPWCQIGLIHDVNDIDRADLGAHAIWLAKSGGVQLMGWLGVGWDD